LTALADLGQKKEIVVIELLGYFTPVLGSYNKVVQWCSVTYGQK